MFLLEVLEQNQFSYLIQLVEATCISGLMGRVNMQMGSGFAREAQSILGCLLFIYLFIYFLRSYLFTF